MTEGRLVRGPDGLQRCWWGASPDDYRAYHDHEWGRPVVDDPRLFEKICLEGFQSGLSWLTILRKRENFRAAFHGFDFERVADMGPADVERLLRDQGIVRHRGKIEATLKNARAACATAEVFGSLAAYFWQFEGDESGVRLAKDLKRREWTFVGPTTAYAFMQAMGLVNDHLPGCCVRDEVEEERRQLVRPS